MALRRIRILKPLVIVGNFKPGGNMRSQDPGSILTIGKDIDETTALNLLRAGIAEDDKSLDGPPEIKEASAVHPRRKKK